MAMLEVTAHLRVRPGQLEGFKRQAAECIRITHGSRKMMPPL